MVLWWLFRFVDVVGTAESVILVLFRGEVLAGVGWSGGGGV